MVQHATYRAWTSLLTFAADRVAFFQTALEDGAEPSSTGMGTLIER